MHIFITVLTLIDRERERREERSGEVPGELKTKFLD